MKLLTVTVPCYNSEAYMRRCVDSILSGGADVEVIIVDDGSTDGTAAIADEYAVRFPGGVRVVHQPNKGHGGAVNAGLEQADGLYFKVVDSDDCLDTTALARLLEGMKGLDNPADLIICNYVYDKHGKEKTIRYTGMFPENRVFTWEEARRSKPGRYLIMHAAVFRTALLRDCGLKLPEHTFYVDNLCVYKPLGYVQSLLYLNCDLYRYTIGRDNQSVGERTMLSRIDQQIAINKLMADIRHAPQNARHAEYLYRLLEIVTAVSSVMLIKGKNYSKKRELWNYIKSCAPGTYKKLRRGFLGFLVNLPIGFPAKLGYNISRALFKFN
ncbi:MAG: glycosyltransferase [Clostridiales bacterium]|nr:glycosyltransferase [Clostridiales bacterium]